MLSTIIVPGYYWFSDFNFILHCISFVTTDAVKNVNKKITFLSLLDVSNYKNAPENFHFVFIRTEVSLKEKYIVSNQYWPQLIIEIV